jgi:hypothetical protein
MRRDRCLTQRNHAQVRRPLRSINPAARERTKLGIKKCSAGVRVMSASNTVLSAPSVIGDLPPGLGFATLVTETLVLAQRLQWETLLAWQRAIGSMQRDLFDQWVCRYAGGVPIDA